ncbi:zf-CSL-domain-containing protein [Dipodascopsis uninucleata]
MDFYDQIEIEDMVFDQDLQVYTYPCPCGDKFQITLMDLLDGSDVAVCPSCSLMIQVIYEIEDLKQMSSEVEDVSIIVAA